MHLSATQEYQQVNKGRIFQNENYFFLALIKYYMHSLNSTSSVRIHRHNDEAGVVVFCMHFRVSVSTYVCMFVCMHVLKYPFRH